ncbi:uncharacterized protein [Dendrobates tinctorius]|uniref:uncharacterized protein n=1 Tax=Dendrobates tinctorius TaxID=92724 RepID=UPI003CC9ABB1
MAVVFILLFIQVIPGQLVMYQPLNVIAVEVNTTAVIPCVSSENSDEGRQISWFRREWIFDARPLFLISCLIYNNKQKYTCKYDKGISQLYLSNGQTNDSGDYFCAFIFVDNYIFGNGTYLNVGDRSTSGSSICILAPLPPPRAHSSLQLACVVHEAHDTVYINWNISGRQHKGRTIYKKELSRTWVIMNFISLPEEHWSHGDKVTCEVWLSSSPSSVNWVVPKKEKMYGYLTHICQDFLIPVGIAGILLLLTLSVHLIKIFKLTGTKTEVSKDNDIVTKDEIVYTELNTTYLTRHRKQ